jgi:hypothetical protein
MNAEILLQEIYKAKIEAAQLIREMLQDNVPITHIAARIGTSTAIVLNVREGHGVFDAEIACRIIINCKNKIPLPGK